MADKYLLRVTAGPSYDPSTHHLVHVNTPHPTPISSPLCTASISVRIQNYRGLPPSSPPTSPYFTHALHTHDSYSISFAFRPQTSITGSALVFGNDFDHPIRDRLPPGFSTGLRIVKWAVDPGLDGDAYAEKPYLYGNALSSVNVLRVGGKEGEVMVDGVIGIEEGGEGGGEEVRKELGVPATAGERKKWFLKGEEKERWVWEGGRVYWGDFFNGFLDFNDFSLRLPGFSLSVLPYLGGEDSLRYVLKNKDTGDVYFVVVFTLVPREDVEDGDEGAVDAKNEAVDGKGEAIGGKGKGEKPSTAAKERFEPGEDDVD